MIDCIMMDDKLLGLLDKYLENSYVYSFKPSEIIKNLALSINNPELIVPVLGTQGMGKSTLINAILGENLLPNEADETTCVPVEIRYGEERRATVCLQNGEQFEINLSCDSLKIFVDNNENEGNEKNVSHIVLELKNELLKNGIVIVDLPGVGSLTQNNQETTMRYIKKLCTAIFVIPTTPTIRDKEAIFIRGTWSTFSSAIFVQNRWDDESDEEVQESVSYNKLILKNIAEKSNINYDENICVVNAYKAAVGRIYDDKKVCNESNLPELLILLENFAKNRIDYEANNFKYKVISYIDSTQKVISQNIIESQMNEEELRAEKCRIYEEFCSETNKLKELIDDLIGFIHNEKDVAEIFAGNISQRAAENVRADIRRLIDGGVVDGEQLTEAFSDYQEKYLDEAIESHYDYMSHLSYELGKRLNVLYEQIQVEKAKSFESQRFDNGQAFKFEKGLAVGIDIVGALGGVGLGGLVGGTIAELAILGSAAGPIGAIVGLLVGVGVTMVGGLVAKKTKHEITAKRGAQAKRAIEPYIEEYKDKLYKSVSFSTYNMLEDIENILDEYMQDRMNYCEEIKRSKENSADLKYVSQFDLGELKEHALYLERTRRKLNDSF